MHNHFFNYNGVWQPSCLRSGKEVRDSMKSKLLVMMLLAGGSVHSLPSTMSRSALASVCQATGPRLRRRWSTTHLHPAQALPTHGSRATGTLSARATTGTLVTGPVRHMLAPTEWRRVITDIGTIGGTGSAAVGTMTMMNGGSTAGGIGITMMTTGSIAGGIMMMTMSSESAHWRTRSMLADQNVKPTSISA